MAESESQPFQLESVTPEMRAESKRARRNAVRGYVSNVRQKQAAAGRSRLDVAVAAELVAALDGYKDDHGLKNRSEALEQLLRLHLLKHERGRGQ